MKSRMLAPGVAEKAVDLMVHQADWVEHVQQVTDFVYMSRVWDPERPEADPVTIWMDALVPKNLVKVEAEEFSQFWRAVDAVLADPVLFEQTGEANAN